MMDMDIEDEALVNNLKNLNESRPSALVFVDDAHPFDLEAYISNYTGRTVIERLIHIIAVCPPLARQAAEHAARVIPTLRDPMLYGAVQNVYESTRAKTGSELPPPSEVVVVDQKWADQTTSKNQSERQKLEVELKNYTNNMIKESIRMAHRDLGNFYRSMGDYTTSMRHHTKSREFCTTSQHVLDMNFACLELLIEQGHYAHIATYVYKADSALDALASQSAKDAATASAAAAAAGGPGAPVQSTKKAGNAEREKVQSKLEYASGLSRLGQGHYERAATHFLRIGPSEGLGDWAGTLLAPGDIAIYGTLCALASFSRGAVNARVLENNDFGVYVEQEPYIRELLDAYMSSKFKIVLELLDKFSTRHYLDIHVASHVQNLTNLIRDKCLVLYLQPFASIRLERMSQAFGWPIDEVEKAVVGLIQSNDVKARVDSLNKVLKAKDVDPRTELFIRATNAGKNMQSATRKLLLRLRLQQAELVVKAPRSHGGGGGGGNAVIDLTDM